MLRHAKRRRPIHPGGCRTRAFHRTDVAQESVRRLCDMLFSRTQEANLLHTTLAGSRNVPLNRLRRASADFGRGKADSGGNASHARCHHRPGAACRYRHHRYGRAYSVHRAAQHHRPREAGRGDRAPQDRHIRWPAATDRTAAKREDNRQAGSPCAEAQRLP